jgi:Mg2+ and Co2+ transporter CorA
MKNKKEKNETDEIQQYRRISEALGEIKAMKKQLLEIERKHKEQVEVVKELVKYVNQSQLQTDTTNVNYDYE